MPFPIDSIARLQQAQKSKGKKKSDSAQGGDFAAALEESSSSQESERPSQASELSSIGTILALQEVGSPLSGRKKAIGRGFDILERLDALRQQLLLGGLDHENITKLQQAVSQYRDHLDSTEDGLSELLDEIDLRAQIELAKYERP